MVTEVNAQQHVKRGPLFWVNKPYDNEGVMHCGYCRGEIDEVDDTPTMLFQDSGELALYLHHECTLLCLEKGVLSLATNREAAHGKQNT